ncbi:MAG: hypothetical protein CMJ15_01515 [Pelagibacterium sp.]|nr:hypothetical protein [Pelagibacterium sp.]
MTRDGLYDYIVRKFMESGLTQATLAKRLHKEPSQISRLLGAPGNWTIDTCAEILFAIDGSALRVDSYKPLGEPPANMREPNCFGDYSNSRRTSPVSSEKNTSMRVMVRKLYADQSHSELETV